MSNLRLQWPVPKAGRTRQDARRPLGQYLLDAGAISQADLLHGLSLQANMDAPLGETLATEGLVTRADIQAALCAQMGAYPADLKTIPPDPALAGLIPLPLCLRFQILPWARMGDALLVATHRPADLSELRLLLGPDAPPLIPVVAERREILNHIALMHGPQLAHEAAHRVPARLSCRTWNVKGWARPATALCLCAMLFAALAIAPIWTMTVAILWAFLALLMTTALKIAAFWVQIMRPPPPVDPKRPISRFRLPRVSVLVPLLKEREIAGALIRRLTALTYPKSLLDVVLVLEESDHVTRDTLARTALPPWISVIQVPAAGGLTTKPRALNYALDFCEGSIVGVWDAEDAPEPDQIERVVTRFHEAPANVACLQGVLDYYNSSANWIARCFTIEYATWWRILLPGIARLGFVVPLGGTTLFFRRDVLERLGGWDAHNVTEDADLGMRLARQGYVTELLATTTFEEANCRAWPWVKQRSRWLKGFLVTWCVHMRAPVTLLRELGWKRFWGVQTILLATFTQFAGAPLLWSFWLSLLGMTHPVTLTLGATTTWAMCSVFILAELANLCIAFAAVSGPQHRHLRKWVLTTPFYFAMGAPAALKALFEFVSNPFYWDKTRHGVTTQVVIPPDVRLPALTG